ncbi:50S ribosomal protein L25 [Alphaproteobacteria bacterium]
MSDTVVLNVELKGSAGTGVAKALRNRQRVPAILYGGSEQLMLSVLSKDFVKEYSKGNLQSRIVVLALNGTEVRAITKDVQLHPLTDLPIHIDFQQIVGDTPVKVLVRVKILNADKCPGIKKGGVLTIVHRAILLMCDPDHIPLFVEIDISSLEIGRSVHIGDLNLGDKLVPVDKRNFAILSISGRAEEEKISTEQTATTQSAATT